MRIAYVCMDPGIPIYGSKGASNHVREFIGALIGLGHEVRLYAARRGGDEPFLSPLSIIRPSKLSPDLADPLKAEVTAIRRNDGLLKSLAADNEHEPFDIVYERYSLWSHAGVEFTQQHGIPLVLEVNSPLRREQMQYRSLDLDAAARAFEWSVFNSASLVVAVSHGVLAYVDEIRRSGPTIVVPNGVDLDLFRGVPRRSPDGTFTVGFLGSLKPWHGLDILLEAFEILSASSDVYRLLIVGEGPMREWIESRVRETGLDRLVQLTGAVEKSRVPEYLASMDVAVAPYDLERAAYFSPLKLFEYMAAGLAIVASDAGQARDLLAHGKTALLAVPGSAFDLADKIQLLREQEELRNALGRSARKEALHCHGWQTRARTVLECLSAIEHQHRSQTELAAYSAGVVRA